MRVVHPDAAGVDAGSEQHYVSVPEDRCAEPVRMFGTFTSDLEALAQWLIECDVKTVAIEATGVYWIPLYEILLERGLDPHLVDSRSIGRRNKKTDVLDCQWLRQLHTYGLLDGAFRPSNQILPLRALSRQRQMLIGYGADHIRHMQKALDLMNVKLHLAVSDMVGVTGLRIIRAIIKGQTDPKQLASLREPGCKSSEETFVKALTGNYRGEHLFSLKQALELFEVYQSKIVECDEQIAAALERLEKKTTEANPAIKRAKSRRKNQPHFDARTMLYQIAGVDLTTIPGLESNTVLTITSEVGIDMSPWRRGKDFSAWLALSPNIRRTGGKQLRKGMPVIDPNRAAQAFRLAAQTLEKTQTALGAFFRRVQSRLGRAGAIKATAHKLSLIYYAMLKSKTPYSDLGVNYYEERYRQRLLNSLKKKAADLGYALSPLQEVH
jgi:transposase